MTATTSGLNEAQAVVERACALADSVLDCRFCDVFGEQHVVLFGEGLTVGTDRASQEGGITGGDRDVAADRVPGVIRVIPREQKEFSDRFFKVDFDHLSGLVGFNSGVVHRPGLTMHVTNQGHLVRQYNEEVQQMLAASFGDSLQVRPFGPEPASDLHSTRRSPGGPTAVDQWRASITVAGEPKQGGVAVYGFGNRLSEAVHDSLRILQGKPRNQTILCTVDEFWLGTKPKDDVVPAFVPLGGSLMLSDHAESFTNPGYRAGSLETNTGCNESENRLANRATPAHIAHPYYGNVLLLAYRNDLQNIAPDFRTWSDVLKFGEGTAKGVEDAPKGFCFSDSSSETLSCALLDALIFGHCGPCGSDLSLNIREDVLGRVGEDADVAIRQKDAIYALYQLMQLRKSVPSAGEGDDKSVLNPHARIYLCWYSQLRELLDRNSGLAKRLDVASLPGGGFRGDWYLGIVNGSISTRLGEDIIKTLASPKEQYKRFARGVGMPTLKSFYENAEVAQFYAWPHGEHVTLSKVFGIHTRARTRATIRGYQEFRSMLHTICEQLEPSEGDVWEKEALWKMVSRLSAQIGVLSGREGD